MTYRELIAGYRKGTLGEEERRLVEQEIEKQEAISDYLFENGEIPELETALGEGRESEGDFVEVVNRSIRRAFWKLGMITLGAAVVLMLFLQFGLPRIVSVFYYNPAKMTGEEQNQMTLDMAVYSDMMLPCGQRMFVDADFNGYGRYDIRIPQSLSYNRNFTDVSGEIVRGKLKLYDTNILKRPTDNCFAWFQGPEDTSLSLEEGLPEAYNMCAAGKREDSGKF